MRNSATRQSLSGHQEDSKARLGYSPKPTYPLIARDANWEGSVVLKVNINAQGQPVSVSVIKSSGFAVLDKSASEGVMRWKFQPAIRAGKAAPDAIEEKVTFRLDDAD